MTTQATQLTCVAVLAVVTTLAGSACKIPGKGGAQPEQKMFETDSKESAPGTGKIPDGNMPRADIPDGLKWELSVLFKDDAAFEAALAQLATDRATIEGYKGKLAAPTTLKACLDAYFAARLLTNKATLYTNMRLDSAQSDPKLRGLNEKSQSALGDLMTLSSFIRQEVLALDDKAFAAAFKKEPGLAEYEAYLNEMRRRRDRVLGSGAERVLSLAGDNLWAEIDLNEIPSGFEKSFGALLSEIELPTIKDEAGKEVQITLSNYGKYRGSKDRRVRRDAVESFFATLKKYKNTFAAQFSGQIDFNIFLARSRNYDTALEAYWNKDNIDPAVYRNLITAIHANLEPLHKYIELRKKTMKLDNIHIYDLYTPLVPSVDMKVSFEEARKELPRALTPLGPDYLALLNKGLNPKNGWIDIYPHKDKDSGAFCASVYKVHPFVKMNYYDRFDDMSTLAHEYGHAIHSQLAMDNQPYTTFNYAPFVAEIASTTNEKFLFDYMFKKAKTDEQRLAILNEVVEAIRTTVYRQTLFAEFEFLAHTAAEQGTPVTAELLNGLYKELITKYYGKSFTIGDNDDIEWAYVPHFYYKFYMATYATGLSSGLALAELINKKGEPAREAFLDMLRGGSSKPPLELLKGAGVDLTKPTAIEAAAKVMAESLDKMDAILSKQPG